MSDRILEYANKMTKAETDSFYNYIRKKQGDKIELAKKSIVENSEKLINEYIVLANESHEKYTKLRDYILFAKQCFKEQKCECGLPLKEFTNRQTGGKFFGCPDYKDEIKRHKAWNY